MKEKTLINDKRLTPTMERLRSGRTQLFRETNNNDRSFISDENCDVSLTHENKAMFAELIDDKWYWVSGCGECNGEERGLSTYIECDKHDRCRSCGISRKDLKGSVWGEYNGWQCKPCKESDDLERREAAFEKLEGEEPDSYYMDEIICPHCGSEIDSDDIHESDNDMNCYVCSGSFSLEVEYTASYTTEVKGKRITK